jgi:hypothetical protein
LLLLIPQVEQCSLTGNLVQERQPCHKFLCHLPSGSSAPAFLALSV